MVPPAAKQQAVASLAERHGMRDAIAGQAIAQQLVLRRDGHEMNHKRPFRIYREERLHVRRRGGRKRVIGTRAPMVLPLMPLM